jgi:hypothetical protein
MTHFLDLSGTMFHDAKPEDFLAFYYKIMDYKEAPYHELSGGVREAVKAAFSAGAQGVVLSRKYSEMKLANLSGAGEGLRQTKQA